MKIYATILGLMIALLLFQNVHAEGNAKGGDEFRKTALEYDAKAEAFRGKGANEIAVMFERLAGIKREAAKLADQGRWDEIDWTEYHKINQKIHKKNTTWKDKKSFTKQTE